MKEEEKKPKTGIVIGVGLGLIGIGTLGYIVYRKKKQQSEETPDTDNTNKQIPAFKDYKPRRPMLAFLTKRGIRNNNPGNIIRTKILWNGEIPLNRSTDPKFKQFVDYKHGVRALIVNLRTYYFRDRLRTIRQIINKWAPPSENKTNSYIQSVTEFSGIHPDIPIVWNKQTLQKIAGGIINHENGTAYLPQGDFERAWNNL